MTVFTSSATNKQTNKKNIIYKKDEEEKNLQERGMGKKKYIYILGLENTRKDLSPSVC